MHGNPVNRGSTRNSLPHGAGISIFRDYFPLSSLSPTYHPLLHLPDLSSTTLRSVNRCAFLTACKIGYGAANTLLSSTEEF